MWEYDTPHVIDAGGYNVQRAWVADRKRIVGPMSQDECREVVSDYRGSHESELQQDSPFYPWTLSEYHEWLDEHRHEFEWATVMDYACEEKFDPLWSVEDRVDRTFEHTVRHVDLNPDYTVLPVLQGRSLEDYVAFYERLEDHGIPTDHVGLGTVCRMSSEKRIVELEERLRERLGPVRLHGFGVKIEAFKHGATFESADSQAWNYPPTNGQCILDDGDRLRPIDMGDDSLTRTVESFKNYYSYVTRLQQGTSAVDYSSGVDNVTYDGLAAELLKV
jgi:hypothetical protein